jgi:hypothetical protein
MMRTLIAALAFLCVLALGFWAYRENYETQAGLRHLRTLQTQIADLREAMGIQRAEWAYLNRPDRLRELADLNFDRLGLLPMDSSQFGRAGSVAYPVTAPLPEITDPVEVGGQDGVQDGEGDL